MKGIVCQSLPSAVSNNPTSSLLLSALVDVPSATPFHRDQNVAQQVFTFFLALFSYSSDSRQDITPTLATSSRLFSGLFYTNNHSYWMQDDKYLVFMQAGISVCNYLAMLVMEQDSTLIHLTKQALLSTMPCSCSDALANGTNLK